jgi:hypothetical protein
MLRALVLATLSFVLPGVAYGQATGVLHIRVALVDAAQKLTPVPRHALLISDNPTTAPPRRVVTGPDGRVDVTLRPGNYTVESDQPVALEGKAYGWTQLVDVVSGRDATLELTAANAEVGPVTAAPGTTATPPDTDPSFLFNRWQNSVVAIWTPTRRASGFIVDGSGLVATSQRLIGTATAVEVQLTATIKVAGSVLVSDRQRDVAVIRIDPATTAALTAVPLACEQRERALVEGQEIVTIGVLLRRGTDVAYGRVRRVDTHSIASDLRIEPSGAGGPVFSEQGVLVGITSVVDDQERRRADARVVRIEEACEAVRSAREKMAQTGPPGGTHLPVEPASSVSMDTLKTVATRRVGSLNPYQVSSSAFDVAFFTPVLTYAAQYPLAPAPGRAPTSGGRAAATPVLVRPVTDFGNWSDYVAEVPPVLLVRITPRQVEGFWTTVARGAAQTQGVSVPPLKHAKAGFLRMRADCGDVEVTPIHPLTLERQISERDTISEGLYVFDAGALGPQCGTVKLTLYDDKQPSKPETVTVDSKIVQQMWEDFALYRDAAR